MALALCAAVLFVWLVVDSDDGDTERIETAGFALAEREGWGYETAAAFDDTSVAADGPASTLVRAFGPVDSENPWAGAFLLFASDGAKEAPLRGEVVDAGGVEAFYDANRPARNVRWVQAEQVLTVRSARLGRDELIDAAAAVATSDSLHSVQGYDLLHEGTFRDFTTRPVHAYGDIPGAAGIVYDRLEEPSAAVVVTWGTADPSLLWAPTVTSASAARTTVHGHEAVTTGPDPFSHLLTVSWMQDGHLVQLVASEQFPRGIDGLVDVATEVTPVDQTGFAEVLEEHRGSVQRHLRRALPDEHVGSDVVRLRSEVSVGVEATVVVRERRSGAYVLQLESPLGARRSGLGLVSLDVTASVAVDLPATDMTGLFVIAGIAPPGTTHATVHTAGGGPVPVMWPMQTARLPGTDHLLFMQPVSTGDGSDSLTAVLHHGEARTEFRL